MKLNNVRQIRAEDFDDEYNDLVSGLASILNSFMQEVVELSEGRVDFENRPEVLRTFEIAVNPSGVPIQAPFKVATGKNRINGAQVIRAINLSNSNGFPTSQPFLNFNPLGGDIIQVLNLSGLRPGDKYLISVIFY
jgi:hypothetical protein